MFESNLQIDNIGNGTSFIHRTHPAAKVIVMFVLIGLNSFASSVTFSLLLTIVCLVMMLLAGVSLKRIGAAYLFILFMAIGLLILYTFLLGPTVEMYVRVIVNLSSIGMPVIFLLFTSPILETLYGIEFLLTPLKVVKVPINGLVLICTIALNFIPIVVTEMRRILNSMAVRGRDVRYAPYFEKAKIFAVALIPLLISTLKSTETLASAIAVKNYDAWNPRTNILSKSWRITDSLFLGLSMLSFYICYLIK